MKRLLIVFILLCLSGCSANSYTSQVRFYKTDRFIDGKMREVEVAEGQSLTSIEAESSEGTKYKQGALWRVPDLTVQNGIDLNKLGSKLEDGVKGLIK